VTRPAERLGGVTADVAGAPGDQNGQPLTGQWRNM
jgi:hypothetical protein